MCAVTAAQHPRKIQCRNMFYLLSSLNRCSRPHPHPLQVRHILDTFPPPSRLPTNEQRLEARGCKRERRGLSNRLACPQTSHAFACARHHLSGGACPASLRTWRDARNGDRVGKGRRKHEPHQRLSGIRVSRARTPAMFSSFQIKNKYS